MKAAEEVRALDDAEALGAIERALHGKLRAHRLSEGFIDRYGQDVLQQGVAEYERAIARGGEIENPGGWIVSTAYRRAIDELRREMREEPEEWVGETPGAINGGDLAAPTESEALANVSAEQLRRAMEKLSTQQRQALGLFYFEELPTREAAEVLGCGQTTFRRRLDSALRVLRQRFGIVVPEPGEELAIEVGLVAWLSLSGARVVPTRGPVEQLIAVGDAMRGAAGWLVDRARDATARVLASGGGEGIGAAASGPLGKTAGGVCAGALAACALTGVIGPGVGGVDLLGGGHAVRPAHRRAAQAPRPAPVAPAPPSHAEARPKASTASVPSKATHKPKPRATSSTAQRTRRATHAATSQFGVESAAPEAGYSAPSEPAPEAAAPSSSSSGSGSSPSPTEIANEQFGP